MTARASFFAYIFSRKQRYVPRRCSVPRGRAALCATAAALCAAGGRAALCLQLPRLCAPGRAKGGGGAACAH